MGMDIRAQDVHNWNPAVDLPSHIKEAKSCQNPNNYSLHDIYGNIRYG